MSKMILSKRYFCLTNLLVLLTSTLISFFSMCPIYGAANKIRVAVFVDHGARAKTQLRDELNSQPDFVVSYIYGDDIREGCLDNFDLIFVPGGSGNREAESLEKSGRNEIRRFVSKGGLYLGVCAGTYLLSESKPEYLGLLPVKTVDSKHWRRGKAELSVEFTSLGMEVFGMDQKFAKIIYHNGPILRKTNDASQSDLRVLAHFREEIVAPNGQRGLMNGAPAAVLGRYNKGLVLGLAPHPELTPGLGEIESNAIRWLYSYRDKNI